ncbi:hypothetical protein [Acidithiobacillus ferridurans]|uniref:hypothetical protein n=1 Tax=Acidithiobacillus ferridurans TaxID=1232575 RepID=UPI001C0784E0|nr:hypothetical protein [Acidithiobacillus ferridurans]MBU2732454.1 hypothetical protein [Acidithiobacillus ferridurans]
MYVKLLRNGQSFRAGPDDKNFIVARKWDEQIERGSLDIETAFQNIASLVVSGTDELDEDALRSVNNFYAILTERSKARYSEFDNEDEVPFERDAREHAEAGIEDFEAKGIFLGGPEQMNRAVMGMAQRLSLGVSQRNNPCWGVIRSTSFEFIVPDRYHLSARIPIDPFSYLQKEAASKTLTNEQVSTVNHEFLSESKRYVFARDFSVCGIF